MTSKKTTLTLDVEYDPAKTDPEGLACALDRLLETALSTVGILEEYGSPGFGPFFVARTAEDEVPRHYVLYDFDAKELATTRVYDRRDEAIEEASQWSDVIVIAMSIPEVVREGSQ